MDVHYRKLPTDRRIKYIMYCILSVGNLHNKIQLFIFNSSRKIRVFLIPFLTDRLIDGFFKFQRSVADLPLSKELSIGAGSVRTKTVNKKSNIINNFFYIVYLFHLFSHFSLFTYNIMNKR